MESSITDPVDEITAVLIEYGIEIDNVQKEQLTVILKEYNNDMNHFISILIDTFHHSETEPAPSTPALSAFSHDAIGVILYRFIKITDLNIDNVVQMASVIIPNLSRGDQVDMDLVPDILRRNEISGRVLTANFKGNTFSKIFKDDIPNWPNTKSVFSKFWAKMNKWDSTKLNVKAKANTDDRPDDEVKVEQRDDHEVRAQSECKLPFSECEPCRRMKSVLAKYQSCIAVDEIPPNHVDADDNNGNEEHSESVSIANSYNFTEDIFDETYSAVNALDDLHHIVLEHITSKKIPRDSMSILIFW